MLLIVDNDVQFSKFVLETARHVGFKGLISASGAAALALVSEYQPHAVILDISLPDIDGWRAHFEAAQARSSVRIPGLHRLPRSIIPNADCSSALYQDVLPKPIQTAQRLEQFLEQILESVGRTERTVLVVEPDPERAEKLVSLLAGFDEYEVKVVSAASGAAASTCCMAARSIASC